MSNPSINHSEKDLAGNFNQQELPEDNIDIISLFKWTFMVTFIIGAFIYAGFEISNANDYQKAEQASIDKSFPELEELHQKEHERLSNYGVVDEAKSIYHIPIDKAIELTVTHYNSKK